MGKNPVFPSMEVSCIHCYAVWIPVRNAHLFAILSFAYYTESLPVLFTFSTFHCCNFGTSYLMNVYSVMMNVYSRALILLLNNRIERYGTILVKTQKRSKEIKVVQASIVKTSSPCLRFTCLRIHTPNKVLELQELLYWLLLLGQSIRSIHQTINFGNLNLIIHCKNQSI